MRKLAIFSCAFAAATAAYVWMLSPKAALICAAVCAVLFAVLFVWRSDMSTRLKIASAGLAIGLIWGWGYEQLKLAPLRAYCGESSIVTAEVSGYPEKTEYGCRVEVALDGGTMLLYLNELYDLKPGDLISLDAEVVDVSRGSGDEENLYYQSRDISLLAFQNQDPVIASCEAVPLKYWPSAWKHTLQNKITELFPSDTDGFVRALLVGDRSGISYTVQNQMSITGLAHVFSVSGMHVSLLVGFFMMLFGRKKIAAIVAIAAMFAFAAMLGFTPSITRAVIMNTILLLAPILKRENDPPTTLSFALMIILLGNPWAIANLSLQLSFLSMTGIFLFSAKIIAWIKERFPTKQKWSTRLVSFVALSLGTTLGAISLTSPLMAISYGSVSLIAPVSNLLLLWMVSLIFTCAIAVLVLGLWPAAGMLFAYLLSWPIRLVLLLVRLLSKIPYAVVYTDSEYIVAWIVAVYLLLLCFFLFRNGRRVIYLIAAVTATLLCAIVFGLLDVPSSSFTMLDVGQGQSILMQNGDFTVMVDCGGDSGDRDGEAAARKLISLGQRQLDALVLTHYDKDHTCGVEQLLQRIEVDYLFVPDISDDSGRREAVLSAAQAHDVTVRFVTEDILIESDGITLQILMPFANSSDNEGLCALMSMGEYDILITGDMSTESEYRLLERHEIPDLEILVAGHHGSKYSTSEVLLRRTKPEIVLISVGKNSYGHPTQAVLDRVAAVGATVYRTDLHGEITITR